MIVLGRLLFLLWTNFKALFERDIRSFQIFDYLILLEKQKLESFNAIMSVSFLRHFIFWIFILKALQGLIVDVPLVACWTLFSKKRAIREMPFKWGPLELFMATWNWTGYRHSWALALQMLYHIYEFEGLVSTPALLAGYQLIAEWQTARAPQCNLGILIGWFDKSFCLSVFEWLVKTLLIRTTENRFNIPSFLRVFLFEFKIFYAQSAEQVLAVIAYKRI